MIYESNLWMMYQQWCQGNSDYLHRYMDFVELAAKESNARADEVMRELQKYWWFRRPE